jgi:hypothetical protein
MISKIEVERFTLSSSKPFDQVVAALNSARQLEFQTLSIFSFSYLLRCF